VPNKAFTYFLEEELHSMANVSKIGLLLTPEALEKITSLISQGYTERAVGLSFGIHADSFTKYKRENAQISKAIADGHAKTITKMISDLIKRAAGYYKTEVKTTEVLDKETGKFVVIKKEKNKKWYPGSDKLLIFYLTNKDSQNWSTKELKTLEAIQDVLTERLSPKQTQNKLKLIREKHNARK